MVGYLDSSILLQNLLEGDESIRQVQTCDFIISSELLKIECLRTIHRYRLEGRINEDDFFKTMIRFEDVLKGISLIKFADEIKKRASESFPIVIKTLDALHLASALAYQNRLRDDKLIVFSNDRQFNRCARALGFVTPFLTDPE